ncbi:MAG: hypothetical protein RIT45_3063 [Pseudomonadota bacterium]|jgi:hypothetical protein
MSDEKQNELENPPADAATTGDADERSEEDDGREAIEALLSLSPRLFGRMCRGIPMRTFLAELSRLDRAVYFRHFKGYRAVKITSKHLEEVFKKEFAKGNGLLAQLAIYNWDETQFRLYGDLQKHVKAINEDVEAIERITDEEANPIFDDLESHYDRRDVAVAAIINGVRVSAEYKQARWGDLLQG